MPELPMRQIETLYRTHAAALLAYLRHSFARCAAPEDLLHETFVQALRHPARLADAASPRACLFAIARHVGLTAARRHRPTTQLDEAQQPARNADDRLATMREAIAQLPDQLRETLELRLQQNLTYAEIADVLEIPLGTVRSRLHTAMHQLRDTLNPEADRRSSNG